MVVVPESERDREGPAGAGPDDRGRPRRGRRAPRPRGQGSHRRRGRLCVDDRRVRRHRRSAPPSTPSLPAWDRAELSRRQVAAGQTLEDMELILSPMVEGGKEAIGSMGDDTPLAVISDKPRLISQFFRQNFSQVTNPPIDSLRERHVMSLKTRFGNLANILDAQAAPSKVLVLESPVLTNADWDRLQRAFRRRARRRSTAPSPPGQRPRGPARRDRRHPRAGRTGGAPGQVRAVPDRREHRPRPHRASPACSRSRRCIPTSSAAACAATPASTSAPPNASTRIITRC